MTPASVALVLLVSLGLTACGGGSDEDKIVDNRTGDEIVFITWTNNPEGEVVKDVNMEPFKFTTSTAAVKSCLYAPVQRRIIENFCQEAGQPAGRYTFEGAVAEVRLTKRTNGACEATVVDVGTNQILDVDNTTRNISLSGISAVGC